MIGDPVGHSLSPRMHQAAFAALGLEFRYIAVHVPMAEVGTALDHLREIGFRGVNVTVPDKAEALDWAESPDELSRRIGAANALDLRECTAINTDAPGFLDTLSEFEFPSQRSALILGSGGSARAVAAALPDAGFQVSVWNRTEERGRAMAEEFGLEYAAMPTADFDLLVNTTSASLRLETLPIEWVGGKPGALAYDLVYGQTPFLTSAENHGMRTIDGKKLLVAQGARSLEWWLGVEAPRAAMREAIQ